jgi:hypothetical protein
VYTFNDLTTGIATLVQRDQDSTFITKCQRWVNMGAVIAYNMYDYWQELQTPMTPFSSVAGQEKYYMPSNFDKPTRFYDFTNNRKMTIQTREEYVDANIASISGAVTGTPQYVSIYGVNAVNYVETSSFSVQAKSSSSQDISGFIVRVEGWLDSAKTILGYTNIAISSSAPTSYVVDPNGVVFYGITRITKSGDTIGFITLADQAGTPNVLGTIAPVDRESRYPVLYLGLIPSGVFSYGGLYKRRIKKMTDPNDYPFAEIGDFLHLYGLGWAYMEEKETIPRAQLTWDKAKELIHEQIRNEMNKLGDDQQHKMVPSTSQAHRF